MFGWLVVTGLCACGERKQAVDADQAEVVTAKEAFVAEFNALVFPRVDFEDAALEDVMSFIRQRAHEVATTDGDAPWAVNHVIRRPRVSVPSEGDAPLAAGDQRLITLKADAVPLTHLLAMVGEMAEVDVYLTSRGLLMVPEGSAVDQEDVEVWSVIRRGEP